MQPLLCTEVGGAEMGEHGTTAKCVLYRYVQCPKVVLWFCVWRMHASALISFRIKLHTCAGFGLIVLRSCSPITAILASFLLTSLVLTVFLVLLVLLFLFLFLALTLAP